MKYLERKNYSFGLFTPKQNAQTFGIMVIYQVLPSKIQKVFLLTAQETGRFTIQ